MAATTATALDPVEIHTMVTEVRRWLDEAEVALVYDPDNRSAGPDTSGAKRTQPFSVGWENCQPCKQRVIDGAFSTIGNRSWFLRARAVAAARGGSFVPCHVCWIVLKARLATGVWPWTAAELRKPQRTLTGQNWRDTDQDGDRPMGGTAEADAAAGVAAAASTTAALTSPAGYDAADEAVRLLPDQWYPHFVFYSDRADLFPPATFSFLDPARYVIPLWQIDFARVRAMLDMCETSHGMRCQHGIIDTRMDSELILIDVRQRCLVRGPATSRYFALSYVVG